MVLSSLDNKWSQDKINTVFMCMCSSIDTCKQCETEQPYNEINYCGTLSDFNCTVCCPPRVDTPLWATNISTSTSTCIGTINHNKTVIVDKTITTKSICTDTYEFRCELYCQSKNADTTCRYQSTEESIYCSCLSLSCVCCYSPYVKRYPDKELSSFTHDIWSGTNEQLTIYNSCLCTYTKLWNSCVNYYSSSSYIETLECPECNECLTYYISCPPNCMYKSCICYSNCFKSCTFCNSNSGVSIVQYAVDEMYYNYQNKNLCDSSTNYYFDGVTYSCCLTCIGEKYNPNSQYVSSNGISGDALCPYANQCTMNVTGVWTGDTNWVLCAIPYNESVYDSINIPAECCIFTKTTAPSIFRKSLVTKVIVSSLCNTYCNPKFCISMRYI